MSESKVLHVRADFNGLFGDILCLSHKGTCEDADERGNRDDLLASGTVERSPEPLRCRGSRWILRIDKNGVMHESELRRQRCFAVNHLNVEKLVTDWRWLCPEAVTLVAKNAFGDLFLRDQTGRVFQLDVAVGKLSKVADSESQFLELAKTQEKREDWFAESDERASAARGLRPNENQCIGFSVPLVFAEGGSPDTPYVVDIYDHVGFLGDMHRQISALPDGAKIRLRVNRES
jgi:hypothetical protein